MIFKIRKLLLIKFKIIQYIIYMNYVTAKEIKDLCKISNVTLWKWRNEGRVKYKRLSERKILYDLESLDGYYPTNNRNNVIYARVKSSTLEKDLDAQVEQIKQYMIANGISVGNVYTDIDNGHNPARDGLKAMMKEINEDRVRDVYIMSKDRLTTVGYGYLENFFRMHQANIIVLDNSVTDKTREEITEDIVEMVKNDMWKILKVGDARKIKNAFGSQSDCEES